jgi:two-component system catabolic regulation response regulator CreB
VKPRVLLVEDEAVVADAVVYALRTDGFEADWAATGKSALESIGRDAPDAILLDVGLPDTSGFELLREIRKRAAVPVLFLTARAEEMDRVLGLEIGADDYIVKPFSPREVCARVRAVLRRIHSAAEVLASAAPNASPAAGPAGRTPFRLDTERRVATYFGEALDLTRSEYRLLEALLEHPGWIRSREQLLSLLWDDPGVSSERSIDSHVKALRAKLRAVRPEIEAILTHRGEGYALRERW